ncbi:MAG: GDP-L-fucose synthase [Nitrosopumilus sp.]|nr:GDP-L-fucose synthase [Nitrosopumilus sp.]
MNGSPKIVITGASGFIATNLRKHLSEKNVKLISISRNNFKEFRNEQKIISKNYDPNILLPKIKNSDALVHLIGIGKQSIKINYETVNVEFTNHILNLCKKSKIKKLIFASGLGVSDKTSLGYFISKYKAEKLITNSGLDYTIFRPSYIVGKNDLLTKYLKKQIKNKQISIPGSGKYSIQPIHISDVVQIIFQSISDIKFKNKTIDLVGPNPLSFEKYVKLFSKGTNSKIRKISLEKYYHTAINNSKSDFGIDDLNILIGNFKGDHKKLQNISGLKCKSIIKLLESGSLF